MFTVENHRLVATGTNHELVFKGTRSVDRLFPLTPSHIIVHYDVCHDMDMNTRAVFASGNDYHLALDGWLDPVQHSRVVLRQYVPFNYRGAHAKGYNDKSIGIAIVNPGPLVECPDGSLATTYGKQWPREEAVELRHRLRSVQFGWWAKYTDEEIDTLGQVCGALLRAYPSIRRIVGHDEVTPGKIDPGPALPLDLVRAIAFAHRP